MEIENYLLHLKSSEKIVPVDANYQFDEDNDVARVELFIDGNTVEVSGDCAESVFIKMSEILKDKYEIHSCYTCKCGNFCPYGDQDNEIFCIKDFKPKDKDEVLLLFEDKAEMKKHSHTLFDVCSDFRPCNEDYYTYK